MTTSPAAGTVLVGETKLDALACAAVLAELMTGVLPFVPEYATSCTVSRTEAGSVTVTVEPMSPAVATFDQAVVVRAEPPVVLPSRVQPAGAVKAPAVVAPVAMSTIALPALTVFGTVT